MSKKAKPHKKSKKLSQEAKDIANGAIRLRVKHKSILIPDASAEHPLVLSNIEQQPLCKPNNTIKPLVELKAMAGYEFFVLTNQVEDPKKILTDKANHLLVLSPNNGLFSIRTDKCGNPDIVQILEMNGLGEPLGTGIALYGQSLYLSTNNSIYQLPYSDGQHSPLIGKIKVVSDLNPTGTSQSSDLTIDIFGNAFIPRTVISPDTTVDPSQAIIKKFNFKKVPYGGYDFEEDGQVFVRGVHTHGLLALDVQSQLWGMNGVSGMIDEAQDNYAEELNKYSLSNNHGFPYCQTKFTNGTQISRTIQWTHPDVPVSLDDYCQDPDNNMPPVVPIAPGSDATSAVFYSGNFCSMGNLKTKGTSVGLPCVWTNTPIVANHGFDGESEGHNIVHIPFQDLSRKPNLDKKTNVLLEQVAPCQQSKCFSPYGMAFDDYGRLFISSDETDEIIVLSRTFSENAAQALTDLTNRPDVDHEKRPKKHRHKDNENRKNENIEESKDEKQENEDDEEDEEEDD